MRLLLGALDQIPADRPLVKMAPTPRPPKLSLVVVRDGEVVRAYWNVCRHLPVPMDGMSGQLPAGPDIVCVTHGARYRAHDGHCVDGPCRGEALEAIAVICEAGRYYAELPDG